MKNLIYLLILITACNQPKKDTPGTGVPAKSDNPAKTEMTDKRTLKSVADIKAVYNATIQKLNNKVLDSITLSYNCQQERSGKITYYTEQGNLKLIKHAYAEYDHHDAVDQYFVQDSLLFFVYQKRLSWNFVSAGVEGATEDKITESRFYLVGDKPIRCLEKKYTISSVSNKKVVPDEVPNRTIACNTASTQLKTFKNLVKFKSSKNTACFETKD
jgi:ribosomal protein L30E